MEEYNEKPNLEEFTEKIKGELREIGLIKQEERLKITKNSRGFSWEFSLLGVPENQLDRMDRINMELGKRLESKE